MGVCKKHPSEPAVGVCACCLRDRLLALQSCVTPRPCAAPAPSSAHIHHPQHERCGRPLFFGAGPPPPPGAKRGGGGFSVLSTLFGTHGGGGPSLADRCCPSGRGGGGGGEDHHQHPPSTPQRLAAAPPSFSSWLAAMFAVRCKRSRRRSGKAAPGPDSGGSCSSAGSSGPESAVADRVDEAPRQRAACSRFQRYRGMSPGSEPEDDEDEDKQQQVEGRDADRAAAASPSGSGSSASSPDGHPALPGPTPSRAFWCHNPAAVKTGFAFCFSPLVRARPHHHRRARVVAGDTGAGHYGELQKPGLRMRRQGQQHQHQQHHHQRLRHGGAKLCPNRSRKLVDLGRFP